jgi:hypothetical protein
MLIRKSPKKINIDTIRRIKRALAEALQLPEDAIITISQLVCLEEDCAPVETVFGLLRPDLPQLQHKVHKEIELIDSQDLVKVCAAWGFEISNTTLEPFLISSNFLWR